jgi:hypothetical protein
MVKAMTPTQIANDMIRANTGRNPMFSCPFCLSFGYRGTIHTYRGYGGSFTEALGMAAHALKTGAKSNMQIVWEGR